MRSARRFASSESFASFPRFKPRDPNRQLFCQAGDIFATPAPTFPGAPRVDPSIPTVLRLAFQLVRHRGRERVERVPRGVHTPKRLGVLLLLLRRRLRRGALHLFPTFLARLVPDGLGRWEVWRPSQGREIGDRQWRLFTAFFVVLLRALRVYGGDVARLVARLVARRRLRGDALILRRAGRL